MIEKKNIIHNDGQIHYRITSGDPTVTLLFIHGAGAASGIFISQLKYFDSKIRSVAIDLPCHGESVYNCVPDMNDYIESVVRVLQNEGITNVIPIGHSMGGGICFELYKKIPDLIGGFVFISTVALSRGDGSELHIQLMEEDYNTFCDRLIKELYSTNNSKAVLALYKKGLMAVDPTMLKNDFRISDRFDYNHLLPTIDKPTLVIANRNDRFVPSEFTKEISEGIPNSIFLLYDTDGHMPHVENCTIFNRSIETFVLGIK